MVRFLKNAKTVITVFGYQENAALPHAGRYQNYRFGNDLCFSRGNWRSFEPLIAACVDAALSPSAEAVVAARLMRLSA
jgi:hypothetical protein